MEMEIEMEKEEEMDGDWTIYLGGGVRWRGVSGIGWLIDGISHIDCFNSPTCIYTSPEQ